MSDIKGIIRSHQMAEDFSNRCFNTNGWLVKTGFCLWCLQNGWIEYSLSELNLNDSVPDNEYVSEDKVSTHIKSFLWGD